MGTFKEEYDKLNQQQRKAVDTIEGPVLVIAGPGTGKTQLLSVRVANILDKTDALPGNILCLTYTESGQQAMQDRLLGMIGDPGKHIQIHTFHGFGRSLITRFNEHFPHMEGFTGADDLALYETLYGCFEKLAHTNPLSGKAYGQFTYQQDARERISQLKQAGINPQKAKEMIEADLDWCKSIGKKIASIFEKTGRLTPKGLDALQNQLAPLIDAEHPEESLAMQCQNELSAGLEEAVSSGKMTSLSTFKRQWLASEEGKLYFKPADQLAKLSALAEIYDLYEQALVTRKLYDYDDMILYALQALETNVELRSLTQETYQYILADEYQDTNPAQARIIELIADNPVNENRPNVMVVGDDDQAIYGFQGAMGDVLVHFRERWRDVTTITLKDNYRSTQNILDTARNVISRGEKRLENYYDDIDKSLTARAAHPPAKPVVVQADSHLSALEKAVMLAKSVPGNEQIAIIAPKHKYLIELSKLLDAAEVPYFYEAQENLLDDEGLQKILLLGELCLAIKQENLAHTSYVLPRIFALAIVEVSKTSAWEIALQASEAKADWWQIMQASKKVDIVQAVSVVENYCTQLNPNDALEALSTVETSKNGMLEQKMIALISHAETYMARETISLGELLKYVELCRQAGIKLPRRIEQGTRLANIRLLSAHKSKGLEFDQVQVLHADNYTWFLEKGRKNNIVLPKNLQYLQPANETTDDKLRLLYVVLTRAKKQLGLITSGQSRRGKATESLPGTEELLVTTYQSDKTIEVEASEHETIWETWYLPVDSAEKKQLANILQNKLARYRLSPTNLTMFVDIPHGGPTTFFTRIILGIPSPVPPEALFGSHVHAVLHHAQNILNTNNALPNKETLIQYVEKQLEHASDNEKDRVIETAWNYLESGNVIKPGGVAEYSFSKQRIVSKGMRITGNVDHYTAEAEKLVVTDYKTGRALNSWRISEDYYKQKLHRFRQQLLFYELLFRSSHEFSSINAIDLKIAFVEPTKRGVYLELALDADAKELLRLQGLMQAVWQRVMLLDFTTAKNYSLEFQGVMDFEQDLLEEIA